MTDLKLLTLLGVSILTTCLAVTLCEANKDVATLASQPRAVSSLASKLMPQRTARTARSLSEMFEKVKSKIFGGKKQASASVNQMQTSASVNAPQRQYWSDLNSFNQQYNPYSSMSGGYQWPSGSSQYMGSQYNGMNSYMPSQAGAMPFSGLSNSQQSGSSSMMSGIDGQSQSQSGSSAINPAANSNSASQGGLLSSASHLIAQYLSPSSVSGGNQPQGSQQQVAAAQTNQVQANGQAIISPQQQSQNQYNEFASILDSMVAQTGVSSPRQPNVNQYMSSSAAGQQAIQSGVHQSAPAGASMMLGDSEMSGSNNIQSYMPAASVQPASQKSSMVSLAEQLAPGAQFNKLVSFPFSLSNNDDASKEGRYKLHIPFLNQHVKRSDQQQPVSAPAQQQQQKYLSSYYSQPQVSQSQQSSQLKATAGSSAVPSSASASAQSSSSPAVSSSASGSSSVSISASSSAGVQSGSTSS